METTNYTTLHKNSITQAEENVKLNGNLFTQKIIGVSLIVLSIIMMITLGDGTSGIFFIIIGIGLIKSEEIYIEFLKQPEPEEE